MVKSNQRTNAGEETARAMAECVKEIRSQMASGQAVTVQDVSHLLAQFSEPCRPIQEELPVLPFMEGGWKLHMEDAGTGRICRSDMAQLLYNLDVSVRRFDETVSLERLYELVEHVFEFMPVLEQYDEIKDVDYNHPNGQAIYYAIANGIMGIEEDGSFYGCKELSGSDLEQILERSGLLPCRYAKEHFLENLGAVCRNGKSRLSRLAAVNVYKKALSAAGHAATPATIAASIRKLLTEIRSEHCSMDVRQDVAGSSADLNTWIYRYPDGLFVREIHLKSNRPDAFPLEIVQLNDTHYNLVNAKDEEEQNPSVMSTKQYRMWLKNGSSAPTIQRCMDFARYADQTIIAGDVLDYLSWGCKQLTVENIFWYDVNVMACLGGHDTTRVMQGVVPDPTTMESRRGWLQEFWPHDISYESRILKDKVLAVVIDNGNGGYDRKQLERLKKDLDYARKYGLIVLIFQHEPICTRNPAETDVAPIRRNDPGNWDFCNRCLGRPGMGGDTQAVYDLIASSADVIKAVFCGHQHSDYYTEIIATEKGPSGETVQTVIPQYVLTGSVYDGTGHVCRIIVD